MNQLIVRSVVGSETMSWRMAVGRALSLPARLRIVPFASKDSPSSLLAVTTNSVPAASSFQRVGREHAVCAGEADLRAVQEDLDIRGGLTLDVIDGDGAGSADQCRPMEME